MKKDLLQRDWQVCLACITYTRKAEGEATWNMLWPELRMQKKNNKKSVFGISNQTHEENRAYCGQPSYPSDQPSTSFDGGKIREAQTGSLTFPITLELAREDAAYSF